MKKKIPVAVFETDSLEFDKEDQGCALISDVSGTPDHLEADAGLFVRLQSWDMDKKHELAKSIEGKKVRIEIYVEDP